MTYTSLLAVDTGHTTGLALWHQDKGTTLQEQVWAGMLPREEAEDWLEQWIPHVQMVVAEQLVISSATVKKGRQVQQAIEMVGHVRFQCRKHHVPFDDKSKPNEAMRFVTDDRLKKLGLYIPGPDHPRDATRHLITKLAEDRKFDRSILL